MLRYLFLCCFLVHLNVYAQELFPYAEAASTLPKHVGQAHVLYMNYKEQTSNRIKNWYGLQYNYGITSKWAIGTTVGVSNHHFNTFPSDIRTYFFNHHLRSYPGAPTLIEGINVHTKYRFYTRDRHQEHLRVAIFFQGCKSFVAHDEAEPVLTTDNSGIGGGFIGTYLIKKFAVSMTIDYIYPMAYYQDNIGLRFRSGNAMEISTSFGYRVWPFRYNSYNDVNVNVYAEFLMKQYGRATIRENGKYWVFENFQYSDPYIYATLKENFYIDGRFYIQLIFQSNDRIDFGVYFPMVSRSYNYWYPHYTIQYTTTLYGKKKSKKVTR